MSRVCSTATLTARNTLADNAASPGIARMERGLLLTAPGRFSLEKR